MNRNDYIRVHVPSEPHLSEDDLFAMLSRAWGEHRRGLGLRIDVDLEVTVDHKNDGLLFEIETENRQKARVAR